jgi:hypothetical protein
MITPLEVYHPSIDDLPLLLRSTEAALPLHTASDQDHVPPCGMAGPDRLFDDTDRHHHTEMEVRDFLHPAPMDHCHLFTICPSADHPMPTHTPTEQVFQLGECHHPDPSILLAPDTLHHLVPTIEVHLPHSRIVSTIELEVPIEIEILEGDPFAANLHRLFVENRTAGGAENEVVMTMSDPCKRGHLVQLVES